MRIYAQASSSESSKFTVLKQYFLDRWFQLTPLHYVDVLKVPNILRVQWKTLISGRLEKSYKGGWFLEMSIRLFTVLKNLGQLKRQASQP